MVLDTRSKIVSAETVARAQRPVTLVAGYFDPYFADHARKLQAIRDAHAEGTLAVMLLDDLPQPLLARQARAEMIAALRVVDLVTTEPVDAGAADVFIDLRMEDAALCAGLRRHVLARSGKPSA